MKLPIEILDLKEEFPNIVKGQFIERKNRFVGICKVEGKIITCHIADTGRLKEILTPNREVLLSINQQKKLKTDSKLIAANMENEGFILINTSIHHKIAEKLLKSGILGFTPKIIKKEVKIKNSRIDFLVDETHFVEVKGCNLKKGNKCLFPDAPTKRGTKHINELIELVENGYKAHILMLILRNTSQFYPNIERDKEFSEAFFKAIEKGVNFIGAKLQLDDNLKIRLIEKIYLP